jgi:hypothetical protein
MAEDNTEQPVADYESHRKSQERKRAKRELMEEQAREQFQKRLLKFQESMANWNKATIALSRIDQINALWVELRMDGKSMSYEDHCRVRKLGQNLDELLNEIR